MLLYITTGESRDREVRPLHTIPDTVNELFYLAMREHARQAVVQFWHQDKWVRDPDWRFDRQVIQLALFLMVNLEVQSGDRVAVFGPLHPLWLQVDFAVQGLRGVPVGVQESLAGEQLLQALRESDPRVIVATDQDCANRLLELRGRLGGKPTIVTPRPTSPDEEGVIDVGQLWDRARILDTPERAQNWRGVARKVDQHEVAGVQYHSDGNSDLVREDFTHLHAMEFVRDRVTRCPSRPDDLAYFEASTVTTVARKTLYALIGDGYTTVTIPGRRGADAISELAPARIVASSGWLERLGAELDAAGGSVTQRKAGERLRDVVGDRLRWIEPTTALAEPLERRLLEAGVPLPAFAMRGKPDS
jgi:hypothetical protein